MADNQSGAPASPALPQANSGEGSHETKLAGKPEYYWPDGSLKWGFPLDVGHLILQLQTFEPSMKVSSVMFIDINGKRTPRAYGLSMSRERWDESGFLNFNLPGPECLAIWAYPPELNTLLDAMARSVVEEAVVLASEDDEELRLNRIMGLLTESKLRQFREAVQRI